MSFLDVAVEVAVVAVLVGPGAFSILTEESGDQTRLMSWLRGLAEIATTLFPLGAAVPLAGVYGEERRAIIVEAALVGCVVVGFAHGYRSARARWSRYSAEALELRTQVRDLELEVSRKTFELGQAQKRMNRENKKG